MSLVAEFRSPLIEAPYSPASGGVGGPTRGFSFLSRLKGDWGRSRLRYKGKVQMGRIGKICFYSSSCLFLTPDSELPDSWLPASSPLRTSIGLLRGILSIINRIISRTAIALQKLFNCKLAVGHKLTPSARKHPIQGFHQRPNLKIYQFVRKTVRILNASEYFVYFNCRQQLRIGQIIGKGAWLM